jgi:hypothetical protein
VDSFGIESDYLAQCCKSKRYILLHSVVEARLDFLYLIPQVPKLLGIDQIVVNIRLDM